MSRLRTETIDVINEALDNGVEDASGFDEACRVVCRVMEMTCDFVETHGNIALSVGSEWMWDDDRAQVGALHLVGNILDELSEYAEERDE